MRVSLLALAAGLAAMPMLASAQLAPRATAPVAQDGTLAETPVSENGEDIVVTGSRPVGSVPGDIPPERVLSPADIRSYGVGSISELLGQLSPQTSSGRGGQPVVLLGGRRISGFAEIRDIPTEAIVRVDILPEEAALKLGYRADQKVINFVLRPRFRAVTVEAEDRFATDGGRNVPDGQANYLALSSKGRLNLHTEYQTSSSLTEDERRIPAVAPTGIDTIDQRPFRTLLPASDSFNANAVYATTLGKVSATINGRVEATGSTGLFGLAGTTLNVPGASPFASGGTATTVTRTLDPATFQPLTQRNSALTTYIGSTLNGDVGKWRWSLTGNYTRVDSETRTDTGFNPAPLQARIDALDPTANPRGTLASGDFYRLPANLASSLSRVGQVDALLNGSPLSLPAGAIATSLRVGASTSDFDSRSTRVGIAQAGAVARDIVNGQINVDLPIASRSKDVLGMLGNLSANFNIAADRLSDFGTLTTLGYGVNWSPIAQVRLIASFTDQDEAPTAQQLGDAVIATPNVRVFDFVRGENATVSRISGGNRLLVSDDRHVTNLGLTLNPFTKTDLTLTASYTATRIDNPIASFPSATAAIAAAFPQRFVRDAAGRLLQIDARAINFAESSRSQLRWGVNYSMPLKSKIQKEIEAFRAGTGPNPFAGLPFPGRRGGGPDGPPGGAPGEGGPPGGAAGGEGRPGGFGGGGFGGGGGGFGGRGGGGPGGGGGRLNFALYHSWHFIDRVTIADGGPVLDLLNGDTVGSGGGQARHELEAQAGYNNNGLGMRLSANWASGTEVRGGTAAAPETLDFGGLATVNLRLFADLGQRLEWVKKNPWLRGMRVSLSIDNIANARQRVTDANGVTPVAYTPDYIDPLGRSVRLSVRKLIF